MVLESAFLLNPPRHRRRTKKARKRKGRTRRRNYGTRAGGRKAARTRKRRKSRRRVSARKAARKRSRKKGRRRNHHYGKNPVRRRRRRRVGRRMKKRAVSRSRRAYGHRRRRNPVLYNGGGVSALEEASFIRIPIPGFIGKIVNGTIGAIVGGMFVFGGYVMSGMIVDMIWSPVAAAGATDTFKQKWLRPILFGASAGLIGMAVYALMAGVTKNPKKARLYSLLAAAGPGVRASAAVLANLIPADATGFVAKIRGNAAGLADYLQVEDYLQVDDAGVSDYLQVDGIYEAGMGQEEIYAGGMEAGFDEDEVIGI